MKRLADGCEKIDYHAGIGHRMFGNRSEIGTYTRLQSVRGVLDVFWHVLFFGEMRKQLHGILSRIFPHPRVVVLQRYPHRPSRADSRAS